MINIIKYIKNLVPKLFIDKIVYLFYKVGLKPTTNTKLRSPFEKGIVVISADFEMAWAFRYSKMRNKYSEEIGLQERDNVPRLLLLFDKYRIPVTWATVGHLFLNNCEKDKEGLPHPEMHRPNYFQNSNWKFEFGDWYDSDPCSNHLTAPAWYAPDLIEMILKSSINHEIACHTFSHIDCTEKNCPPELFISEIEACKNVAADKGIELKSMVYPGGTFGNFNLLKKMGFTSYRKEMKYNIDLPSIDKYGLVQIPSSCGLDKWKYDWNSGKYIKVITSYLDKAAKYKKVAHLWFHPSMNVWYLENVLPTILKNIFSMREQGKLEILTMGELAERVLNKN